MVLAGPRTVLAAAEASGAAKPAPELNDTALLSAPCSSRAAHLGAAAASGAALVLPAVRDDARGAEAEAEADSHSPQLHEANGEDHSTADRSSGVMGVMETIPVRIRGAV